MEVEGIKLTGKFYIPGDESNYPAICICHGIPSCTVDPGDKGYPYLAETLCQAGFCVLIFNFRGTGTSEGNFDIVGWIDDLATALDYLWMQPEIDRSRIGMVGFSAGAAVAICMASQDSNIAALAVCACPADFSSIVKDPFGSVEYFRTIGIIRDKDFPDFVDSWADNFQLLSPIYYIDKISPRPILLLHGRKDEVVPVENATGLYNIAHEPKELIILENAGHRLRRDPEAVQHLIKWFRKQFKVEGQL